MFKMVTGAILILIGLTGLIGITLGITDSGMNRLGVLTISLFFGWYGLIRTTEGLMEKT